MSHNRDQTIRNEIKTLDFSFEGRSERLIAGGRVILASFSLLAIWLDPSEPAKYAALTYSLLIAYVLYALVSAWGMMATPDSLVRLRLITHIFDLSVFSTLIYLTEGPTSPFFLYFIFSILCGTLRWQWRGTLWTAVVALAAFLAMGFYAAEILQDPEFELNRFIMRAAYLGVVAVLFGYLGVYESRRRNHLAKLASWPRAPSLNLEKVIAQNLEEAQKILNTPRVLMAWEEFDEPWLYLAMFSDGKLQQSRKPPGSVVPLVADSLEGKSFLSQDVRQAKAIALDAVTHESQHWQGECINNELQQTFAITSVLSVQLSGETFKGRLFFLDKADQATDDLILAEIIGAQLMTNVDLYYFLNRLKQVATRSERIRLSHNLHDGVLQSLTTAGLHLQVVSQMLDTDPASAREYIAKVQELIIQEQRDLRSFVEIMKAGPPDEVEADFRLTQLLEELSQSIERQWSLHVELKMDGLEDPFPSSLGREIYHLIREGMMNAARHAQASVIRVDIQAGDKNVHISVSDNGHGFPFHGRYDNAMLAATGFGPSILKSRVSSLGGSLNIESSESGSRLELTVPFSLKDTCYADLPGNRRRSPTYS